MNAPRTLLVEGWRSIPHSYAIINSFQCLEFLKEPNLTLRHRDIPYANPNWKTARSAFAREAHNTIAAIPALAPTEKPDAVYRITFPYILGPSGAGRTLVYGTSEYRCIPSNYLAAGGPVGPALRNSSVIIIAPSTWSREGFLKEGADPNRVIVVPNGIDPEIFRPMPEADRQQQRSQLAGTFVFLSLGAMTGNKGILELLKAFAVVAQKFPHVRIVLKGMGELYQSKGLFVTYTNQLTAAERQMIRPRVTYVDQTLSFTDMARLYQLADVYVSPYRAEGFNMPVLEAVACGVPVICTAGGATDDFTTDDFALRINSSRVAFHQNPDGEGTGFNVEFDHLIHQMMTAVESPQLAAKARVAGPAFVANGFTWRQVTQKLLKILFDDAV
jgi:glycosyltransferase involved in cell wall biosynthesis